ncbi:MAG TPA: alpha-ketoglutarate-dependent dioxygenase AlkB [Acidimicrobiales bacterium]
MGADAGAVDDSIAVREDAVVERIWLDERSWVDLVRGWLSGADSLYEAVVERAPFRQGRIFRYDRWIDEPRLGASYSTSAEPAHPALRPIQQAIRAQYKVPFDGYGLAWYRDGRDGQAFHRDRDLRWLDDTVIVLLTLGATRPWLLRPRPNRYDHEASDQGATHDLRPASGDLIVMGGATQQFWEHSVPKVRTHRVAGRVSIQWRWTSGKGRPVVGASYRAPRTYTPDPGTRADLG